VRVSTRRWAYRFARAISTKQEGKADDTALSIALTLPPIRRRITLDERRIQRYERACGLTETAALPIAYPETLFLAPMAALAIDPDFPVSPLGLSHVRQQIARVAALPRRGALELACRLAAARTTDRGVEVDLAMEAFTHGATSPAWAGVATLLSRNPATRATRRRREGSPAPTDDGAIVPVPRLTGVRYALASGDFNPHHLFRFTARPLGYHRPIAHGMWTLARALGLLETRTPLPATAQVDARFQRPVFMPGQIAIRIRDTEHGARLDVVDPRTGVPHLAATVGDDAAAAWAHPADTVAQR